LIKLHTEEAANKKLLDLEKLKFGQGGRLMVNKKCHLPKGSTKLQKKGYDEVYVPAVRSDAKTTEKLIDIKSLPEWT